MNFLVVLVVDNPDNVSEILQAWDEAGAPGVTILDSYGIGRLKQIGLRDDLPLMPSLSDLLGEREEHHSTLFSLVKDETLVDQMVEIAQSVIGDLEEPNTGLLFVLPVVRAYGLNRKTDPD